MAVTFVRLFAPHFLIDFVHTLDQFLDPPLSVILNFLLAAACALLGLGMIRWGRHLLRGTRFLFALPVDAVRRFRRRDRKIARAPTTVP
jgi:hypothetical protein